MLCCLLPTYKTVEYNIRLTVFVCVYVVRVFEMTVFAHDAHIVYLFDVDMEVICSHMNSNFISFISAILFISEIRANAVLLNFATCSTLHIRQLFSMECSCVCVCARV